jgi:transcription antitermination factor NusG
MSKKWFVVHAYSGFEKSVQRALVERIKRSDIAEQFGKTSGMKTPVVESTGTGGGMKLFCAGVGAGCSSSAWPSGGWASRWPSRWERATISSSTS